MDRYAALAHPLEGVFQHLATPEHLSDWLPEVARAPASPALLGVGGAFSLALGLDGEQVPATGELIAYEPPWSVAYRLLAGSRVHVLRVTCTSSRGLTRVHVHQSEDLPSLAVDLDRLGRALNVTGPIPPPHSKGTNPNGGSPGSPGGR
jgi:uncharacterized protein YndB with AHSA1/START domain